MGFWGMLFVFRNLACSLIPSFFTAGSAQVVSMFLVLFTYFLASATCSPWRDELSNSHDLIMVGALLMTLVVAQALQIPSTGGFWFCGVFISGEGRSVLLEAASSFLFIG